MNEKRAKELRKMIYGDQALRQTTYKKDKDTPTIYADTLRQRFQMAKGRKDHMPKMGRLRLVAKRPRAARMKTVAVGAFGRCRIAALMCDMRVYPRSKRRHDETRNATKQT